MKTREIPKTAVEEGGKIRIGNTVKITKCAAMPQVVGERAEILDMQIQEFDRYTAYPVWVKMTTGERKGKTYGFKYDELEVIAPDRKPVGVETSIAEHLKEVLDEIGEQLAGGETAVRIGAPIRIIKYGANPRMEGLMAEIVDMQIQEYDRYAVCPVWAKITCGEYEGKVCGFHYDEFVVLPKVTTQDETKEKLVERLEETLNTIRIGNTVKITKCAAMPQVVGERAEILDMQIQEFDRYTTYPVWVKMTTGERKGKTYGFKYDELEVIAPDRKPVGVETSIAEHLKEILDGIGEQLAGGETAVRIGAPIRIIKCGANPRMEGLMAEIVDMQIQEYDRYAVYPVWAKITYGEYEGKVCGFHYDEFVVLPKVTTQGETKEKLVERLEETLNTIRIGRLVKIKKCDSLPELVGEQAEIFDMQIQEYDLYATYPLWVKMISGERKGKVYGFQYDEIEICPRISKSEIKPASFPKQIEEILSRITTLDEVSEIERVIREVKGKVVIEPERQGFWHDKTPCWQMLRCPEAIRNECPAFKHQDTPCWQIEGTYSKLHEYGARGDCTKICENCRVYKRYGNAEPIEIKLRGRGLNQALMEEAAMKAYTKCPGSNGRHLRVDLYNCPKCGAGVEIFSDEITVQCQKCGEKVYREMSPSYVKG